MIKFRSKKGVTLTELIIVCAVVAVIIGATSTVLIIGGRIFRQGADTTDSMGQIEIAEKWLQNSMSVANTAMLITDTTDPKPAHSVAFYFDDTENLHIHTNNPDVGAVPEEDTQLDSIRSINIKFTAGTGALSRITASYTIETKTGHSTAGAIVMNNVRTKFDWLTEETLILQKKDGELPPNTQGAVGMTIIKAS